MQRGEPRRAEPELGAEALAGGSGLGQLDDRPRVAEPRAARQQAELRELHGAGDCGAHGDGVHAGAVAGVVGLHDRRQVAHPALGAERPDALVFGALPALAAGLGAPGAADDAAAAGGPAPHVVALERLAGDGGGALEPALAVVARGQGACLVEHVDEHRRAELGQRRGGDRVGLEQLLRLVHDELEALWVGHRRLVRAAAADDQRLEPLGAHHGAEAAAADGSAAVVDDAREQHAALAGRADHRGLAGRVQLAQTRERDGHRGALKLRRRGGLLTSPGPSKDSAAASSPTVTYPGSSRAPVTTR